MWCLGLRGPVGVVDVGNTRFETAEMGFFVWGLFSLVHCVQVVCSGHQDERRRQQTLLIRSSRHPSSGSDTKPEKQKHKISTPSSYGLQTLAVLCTSFGTWGYIALAP